jgi:hypothetical protein
MNFNKYSKYNNNTNYNKSPKPFCPVCKKNGRPESEYNSHFIRETSEENSPITCPILLNMECNHCGEKGHLVARCPRKKCVFCNEFGHTVSRCTAGSQEEIDRFLDERHNDYVQRRDTRYDSRNQRSDFNRSRNDFNHSRNDFNQPRNDFNHSRNDFNQPRNDFNQPRNDFNQPRNDFIQPPEDNFPSLSKKPVKIVEQVKGYANIATIAAPLQAPKPVLKPVAKPVVEEEYETDDDDVEDDDSVYSSKIPDDDNW